jgi:hypothetical protein
MHTRRSGYAAVLSKTDLDRAREMLAPEYRFLERIKGLRED